MNLVLACKTGFAPHALSAWTWRMRDRCSRFARGIAYAFGCKLPEDAMHTMRIEMNEGLGYYPLMTLATEDLQHEARSRFGDEQAGKLQPYFAAACDRVASKWSDNGDSFYFAVDWGLEQAVDYAGRDGIVIAEED